MKDILKLLKRKPKESISNILRIEIKNDENLNFVIPNISCISDVIEEQNQNKEKTFIVQIFTPNRTQIFFDNRRKANNTKKKILEVVEKWWWING